MMVNGCRGIDDYVGAYRRLRVDDRAGTQHGADADADIRRDDGSRMLRGGEMNPGGGQFVEAVFSGAIVSNGHDQRIVVNRRPLVSGPENTTAGQLVPARIVVKVADEVCRFACD